MKILHEPKATVEQIVKDLELIVSKNPECLFAYGDCNGSDWYLSKSCFIDAESISQDYDLVVMCFGDEDDALDSRAILEYFKLMPSSAKVVMAGSWDLFNLEEVNGHFLFYDDDCPNVDFLSFDKCDVRLFTIKELQKDMERFAEKYPDSKVVALGKKNKVMKINDIYDDDAECFLACRKNGDDATVASFMEAEFYYYDSGVVVSGKNEYGDWVFNTIQVADDGTIFFEYEMGGEVVIACRVGEVLYNCAEEYVAWHDLCDLDWDDEEEEEEED